MTSTYFWQFYLIHITFSGVKEEKIDTTKKNPDNLCALCKDECMKDGNYSGYSGAFKCLMDGAGEVAFVKHTTVMSDAPASASDYLYLCYDGTTAGMYLWVHDFLQNPWSNSG